VVGKHPLSRTLAEGALNGARPLEWIVGAEVLTYDMAQTTQPSTPHTHVPGADEPPVGVRPWPALMALCIGFS
jgi:hypothetical protein